MDTYVILRRGGWKSPEELEAAAERSSKAGEEMADDIRWIRSYVLEEGGGSVGTVCIYQATGEDAIRKHGDLAELAGRRGDSDRRHRDRPAGPWLGRACLAAALGSLDGGGWPDDQTISPSSTAPASTTG